MSSWWCNILFLMYSCSSNNSEVIQVNYTPHNRVKINVEMSNMKDASSYVMLLNSKEGLHLTNTSGMIETSTRKLSPEFTTDLEEGHNNSTLYVKLIHGVGSCCGLRRIAKFVVKQHTRDAAKEDPCMTTNGCTTKIDWKNTCTVDNAQNSCIPLNQIDELAPMKDKRETSKSNHTWDSNVINVQQSNWKTQQTGEYEHFFDEGEVEAYTCMTDFLEYRVQWRHMKETYLLSSVEGHMESSVTLNMTMTRFDHGTTIRCVILDYQKLKPIELARSYKVKFRWNPTVSGVRKPLQYNELMVTPKPEDVTYFNKGEHVEYNCHYHLLMRKSWLRIKDNAIDSSFASHEYVVNDSSQVVLPLNLSEPDSGASYVCQGFSLVEKNQNLEMWTRHLSKRINLLLNGTNRPTPEPDVDQSQTGEMQDDDCFYCGTNLVYFGLGAGALIIVILIVASWAFLGKRQPNRSPHEVETYACPSTVQYVDLQTTSINNNGRNFKRENTPYARIVGVLEPNK